ncbi:hypothetical protein OA007_02080 [SAR116 cluster bacterium]|nr:hypothetical protein [SAR116 cluster bacterium]
MPVDLFFQLLMRVVRLTRLAPRVARILGLRVSGRTHRDLRFGSYILCGVGIALAVAYFVYYLLGLQVDQSGRLLHEGAAVGVAEIFRGNFVIVSVVLLVVLNMVPYRRLQLPAAVFALALVIISILSLHVIGGCSYAFSSAELLMEGGSRRSGKGAPLMAIATYWPCLAAPLMTFLSIVSGLVIVARLRGHPGLKD